MELRKSIRDELPRIKDEIKKAHDYFNDNYNNFHRMRYFIFRSSLSTEESSVMTSMGKPSMQFNELEPYLSRLVGEFSHQTPSIYCYPLDGQEVDEARDEFLEGYCRQKKEEAEHDNAIVEAYREALSGGFSAFRIYVDWQDGSSFIRVPYFEKVANPTLCFWDYMAVKPHKSDARFCGEIYYLTKDEAKREFPNANLAQIQFTRNIGGFSWAFTDQMKEVIVVCDYYEKKTKRVKWCQLSDGRMMSKKDYQDMLMNWEESGVIEVPPIIINERWRDMTTICRYRLIENEILDYEETEFSYLPYVFVDGNSQMLRINSGNYQQVTRSYFQHALDVQRLKNFAGSCLADWLQSMVMHKIMIAREAIPDQEEYQEALRNVQKASTLVYNATLNGEPLPPPKEINVVPAPPEVTSTFYETSRGIQSILGSYDAALGINSNQLSGVAIVNGATQNNATAMPNINNFLVAFGHVFTIIIDLLPKLMASNEESPVKAVMPIKAMDGTREFIRINQPNGLMLNYDSQKLKIGVKAGVNYEIQRMANLEALNAGMMANPGVQRFMAEEGLDIYMENIPITKSEVLQQRTKSYMERLKKEAQMQQQMAQQQAQNNPLMIKAQNERLSIMQKEKQSEIENQLKAAQLMLEQRQQDLEELEAMVKLKQTQIESMIAMERADAEKSRAAVDGIMAVTKMHHEHKRDKAQMLHKMVESDRAHERSMRTE